VEGSDTFGTPQVEARQAYGTRVVPEAEALRLALLTIGLVMLVPSAVLFAGGIVELLGSFGGSGYSTDRYDEFLLAVSVLEASRLTGAVTVGALLLLASWKPPVVSVRSLLYPALVMFGVYMVFIGVIGIAFQVAQMTLFDESIGAGVILFGVVYHLPEILGGMVLLLIGMGGFSRTRQGPRVVGSWSG
jgi:hypothetical protein